MSMMTKLRLIQTIDRFIAPKLLDHEALPSRLYRARIAVVLALAVAFLSLTRSLLFEFGSLPMQLCLLMIVACLGGLTGIRYLRSFEATACLLLITLLSVEASLAIASQSIFSTFYSWLPLSIAFCCFFSGLKWGGVFALIAVSEALLVIHLTQSYGTRPKLYNQSDSLMFSWQFHFLMVELLSTATLFTFNRIRRKAEDELQSRQIMRAKATRKAALADVVGSLAHELNNPLAIIHGSMLRYLYELDRGEGDAGLRQYLWQCMDDALVRIEGVATGLKTFANGDANEPMRSIPLQKLIQSAERQAKDKIRGSGATLSIENSHPNLHVMCRPQQIILVLASLLENAATTLKNHSANPQMRILCVVSKTALRIEVVDNGGGVDPEVAERLFQPFVSHASGKSLGMSLSVCRGVIEEHGGRIGFMQERTETHFWFELPLNAKELV